MSEVLGYIITKELSDCLSLVNAPVRAIEEIIHRGKEVIKGLISPMRMPEAKEYLSLYTY